MLLYTHYGTSGPLVGTLGGRGGVTDKVLINRPVLDGKKTTFFTVGDGTTNPPATDSKPVVEADGMCWAPVVNRASGNQLVNIKPAPYIYRLNKSLLANCLGYKEYSGRIVDGTNIQAFISGDVQCPGNVNASGEVHFIFNLPPVYRISYMEIRFVFEAYLKFTSDCKVVYYDSAGNTSTLVTYSLPPGPSPSYFATSYGCRPGDSGSKIVSPANPGTLTWFAFYVRFNSSGVSDATQRGAAMRIKEVNVYNEYEASPALIYEVYDLCPFPGLTQDSFPKFIL